jgi:hypothetical protein
VNYILTPKGFSEKFKRSSEYIVNTIDAFTSIKERIKKKIKVLYEKGSRKFVIMGEGDLAGLTEMAFKELDLKDADYCLKTKPEEISDKDSTVISVQNLSKEIAEEI